MSRTWVCMNDPKHIDSNTARKVCTCPSCIDEKQRGPYIPYNTHHLHNSKKRSMKEFFDDTEFDTLDLFGDDNQNPQVQQGERPKKIQKASYFSRTVEAAVRVECQHHCAGCYRREDYGVCLQIEDGDDWSKENAVWICYICDLRDDLKQSDYKILKLRLLAEISFRIAKTMYDSLLIAEQIVGIRKLTYRFSTDQSYSVENIVDDLWNYWCGSGSNSVWHHLVCKELLLSCTYVWTRRVSGNASKSIEKWRGKETFTKYETIIRNAIQGAESWLYIGTMQKPGDRLLREISSNVVRDVPSSSRNTTVNTDRRDPRSIQPL